MLIKLWRQQARRYDVRTDSMVSGTWRFCLRLRSPFAKGWSLESADLDEMNKRLAALVAEIREPAQN